VVSFGDISRNLFYIATNLSNTTLCPYERTRSKKNLQLGIRKHDRSDVATFNHSSTAFCNPSPLPFA
jgi:hypothetical protein